MADWSGQVKPMSTAEDTVHRDLEVLAKRQGIRIQELTAELARLTHETQWVRKKIGVPESAIIGDVQGALHVLCSNAHGMTEYINAGKCDDKEGQIARQSVEIVKLKAELAALESRFDDWLPTAENINALPESLRRYVFDLETRCDPAGEVALLSLTKDQNTQLQAKIAELMSLRRL